MALRPGDAVAISLYDVLGAAAAGRPPEPDGTVEVLGRQGPASAVMAFSAHFVVAADVDPEWVRGQLPPGDWTAPHGARFLVALADRVGADIGALDVVLARTAGPADETPQLVEIEARDHPRVVRALRYREDVRVWRTPPGDGHVLVGRGLAGRWEMALEVEPAARGVGLGRRLAAVPDQDRSRPLCATRRTGLRRVVAKSRERSSSAQLSPCGGSGGRSAGPASP